MSDLNSSAPGRASNSRSLDGLVVPAAVASAVAVVAGVTSDATSGVPRVASGLVMVVAGLSALYTVGVLAVWVGLNRLVDSVKGAEGSDLRGVHRLPWFVWAGVPLLDGAWALSAWLSGYDAAEWLWTGASVAVASLVVVAAHLRRP